MDANSFIHWLDGFFEISSTDELTKEQIQIIKEKLKTVVDGSKPAVKPSLSNLNGGAGTLYRC